METITIRRIVRLQDNTALLLRGLIGWSGVGRRGNREQGDGTGKK